MKRFIFLASLFYSLSIFSSEATDSNKSAKKPSLLESGKAVYETNCLMCHGPLGDGNGRIAKAIKGEKPRSFVEGKYKFGSDKKSLFQTITKGIAPNMPSWQSLSKEEREAVVIYIMNFKK